jgi:hypothetical protein
MIKFKNILFIFTIIFSVSNISAQMIPNDPYFNKQLYLYNKDNRVTDNFTMSESYYDISFPYFYEFLSTHDISKYKYRFDSEDVNEPVMAVLLKDFDIINSDYDLDKLYVNHNEIFNDGLDNDGNGYVDDYYITAALNNKQIYGKKIYYDKNHFSKEDGLLMSLIAKTNNHIGYSGILIGGKVMLFDVSNTENKINMEYIQKILDYIYSLKQSGKINIRIVLFPYNLYIINNTLENYIKDMIRKLASVGVTFIAPSYDPNYKENFITNIHYRTWEEIDPEFDLESRIQEINNILNDKPNSNVNLDNLTLDDLRLLQMLYEQNSEYLNEVENLPVEEVLNLEVIQREKEESKVQDLCKFQLLNAVCASSINKNLSFKEDYNNNYVQFVSGTYFEYIEGKNKLVIDDSTLASAITAGTFLNALYIYPQLFKQEGEILNVFNTIAFMGNSSLSHAYDYPYMVEQLSIEQPAEEYLEYLERMRNEGQNQLDDIQANIIEQTNTELEQYRQGIENLNNVAEQLAQDNQTQEEVIQEESEQEAEQRQGIFTNIRNSIQNIFGRNKDTNQVFGFLRNLLGNNKDNEPEEEPEEVEQEPEESEEVNTNISIDEVPNPNIGENVDDMTDQYYAGLANSLQNRTSRLIKLATYGKNSESDTGMFPLFADALDVIAVYYYIPPEVLQSIPTVGQLLYSLDLDNVLYKTSFPGLIYNNMEKIVSESVNINDIFNSVLLTGFGGSSSISDNIQGAVQGIVGVIQGLTNRQDEDSLYNDSNNRTQSDLQRRLK